MAETEKVLKETVKNSEQRNFRCKDDELIVICGFVSFSAKRDMADFLKYSPMFSENYFGEFDRQTTAATELIIPRIEITALKVMTEQLRGTMNALIDPISHTSGYVDLASNSLRISVADFGLTTLRERVHAGDAEGVMKNLRLVIANIKKYSAVLVGCGFSDKLLELFENALSTIAANNQKQYEMIENRKAIVQLNRNVLNLLYAKMMEICKIGKILYRYDPVKKSEYTFTDLKRKVSVAARNSKNQTQSQKDQEQ